LLLLDERLEALHIVRRGVFFPDDHDVASIHLDIDVRDADSVNEPRTFAANKLNRVAGQGPEMRDESAFGLVHQLGDLMVTALGPNDQSPVPRIHRPVAYAYPSAVLDLLEDL